MSIKEGLPLVSVIIPTYNRAHLISESINSVLAQTYSHVEIIVVDDGSTDNTKEVLACYSEKIRYIPQENGGAAKARNTGIRAATGDFLNFLDSDDFFLPDKLALQVAYLEKHPDIDLVLSGWQDINEDDGTILEVCTSLPVNEMLKAILLSGNQGLLPPHAALLRRHCFDRSGFFDETLPMREEQEFWLRVALSDCKFGMIEQVLCNYQNRAEGKGKNWAKLEQTMPIILARVFNHPHLPADIAAMQEEIYARSYLAFSEYFCTRSHDSLEARLNIARGYMVKAFNGKVNISSWRRDIFDTILYTAIELGPNDSENILREILADVNNDESGWLKSYLLGRLHVILAFKAYETGNNAEVVRHVWQGWSHQPNLFRDRGAFSIFLRSLLKWPVARLISN